MFAVEAFNVCLQESCNSARSIHALRLIIFPELGGHVHRPTPPVTGMLGAVERKTLAFADLGLDPRPGCDILSRPPTPPPEAFPFPLLGLVGDPEAG